MSHLSWKKSIGFLFQNALFFWRHFQSTSLMALYHLTCPVVCPPTHPPDLFTLPLKNFWPSPGSTWKVLVHDLFDTRLHSFGIHYHWRSASAPLYHLLSPNQKHVSPWLPFYQISFFGCVYTLCNVKCMVCMFVECERILTSLTYFSGWVFGNVWV